MKKVVLFIITLLLITGCNKKQIVKSVYISLAIIIMIAKF